MYSGIYARAMRHAKQLAFLLPVTITFNDLVGSVLRIDGSSMQPTLNADPYVSDWCFVEKVSYKWLRKYERGDVAVFWAPDSPHQQLVKRMVAVEFDVVWDSEKNAPVKIPQGRCWVEGDNQEHSGDSRTMYGPVHLGLLEGRVTHIVWPPWRIQAIPRVYDRDKLVWVHEQPADADRA